MSNRGRHHKKACADSWIYRVLNKDIINRILDYQFNESGIRDLKVFERTSSAGPRQKGFSWDKTKEGFGYWHNVMHIISESPHYQKQYQI